MNLNRPRQRFLSSQRQDCAVHGFTLVEMIASLAVASLLFVAIGSAVMLAAQATPEDDDLTANLMQVDRVVQDIADEMQQALYVFQRGLRTVTFVVPDRNGDGEAEVIRYNWSGNPGDPLLRQYNGATATAVLNDVQDFQLTYNTQSATLTYPGAPIESDEFVLSAYPKERSNTHDVTVKTTQWQGQHFDPDWPGDALKWRPTRVRLRMRSEGAATEEAWVQLRTTDEDKEPTTTVIAQQLLEESSLLATYAWREFTYPNTGWFTPGDGLCAVVRHNSAGGDSAKLEAESNQDGYGGLRTTNAGASWSYLNTIVRLHEIFGRFTLAGPSRTLTREQVRSVGLALTLGATKPASLATDIALLNLPESLTAVWQANFSSNPLAIDLNMDGVNDWRLVSGGAFPLAQLGGGVWDSQNKQLRTTPDNDFTEPITVELRYQDALAPNNKSARFAIGFDRAAGQAAELHADLNRETNSTQTLTINHHPTAGNPAPLMVLPNLPDRMIDLALVLDPTSDTVAVFMDGEHRGTFAYARASGISMRDARLYEVGPHGKFDFIRLRMGGTTGVVANTAPIASAVANTTTGTNQLDVNFNASASSDPDGDALSYYWSFGDGTYSYDATPPTHRFQEGQYVATLFVYDGKGGLASSTVTITVN